LLKAGQQDANDARKGEGGIAGEVLWALAMARTKIRGVDDLLDSIDRTGI
jgi:hypothetical protein